ncbi:MAG: hypothetical protein AB8E82_15830 [Aureispira sp.]
MQRYFCLFVLLLTLSTAVQAQIDDEMIDSVSIVNPRTPVAEGRKSILDVENLFVGMTFSVLFGNFIFLDASPYVGYLLNKHVGVGIGATYIYTAYWNGTQYVGDNVYGGRLFANLRPFAKVRSLQGLYAHVEGEYLNHTVISSTGRLTRQFVPAVNLGIGYNTAFEKGFSITTELLVNALWFSQRVNGPPPVYTTFWQYRIGLYYAF